jgi:hypothetical protein
MLMANVPNGLFAICRGVPTRQPTKPDTGQPKELRYNPQVEPIRMSSPNQAIFSSEKERVLSGDRNLNGARFGHVFVDPKRHRIYDAEQRLEQLAYAGG